MTDQLRNKSTLRELIDTVSEFTPAPGSIIALRLRHDASTDALSAVAEQAKNAFPDNRVVVLARDVQVEDRMIDRAAEEMASWSGPVPSGVDGFRPYAEKVLRAALEAPDA